MNYQLGIIGAGNMAEAIVRGAIRANVLTPNQIIAADPSPQRRDLFQNELHIRAVAENATASAQSKTILLSIKPQIMPDALPAIGQAMNPNTLVISIMAGISSDKIELALGTATPWRVVRTMPNTPMLIGEGMAVISKGKNATADDLATTRKLFQAAATVIELPENMMDAVTALSGSGPAYFFLLTEKIIDAGIQMGFTRQQAHLLATRTAAGAAKMMLNSTDSPAELRKKVTSPNGTTQAAIEIMQQHNMPETIVAAVQRAADRSRELGM